MGSEMCIRDSIVGWAPPEWRLSGGALCPDWPWTTDSVDLLSPRLKEALDSNLTARDDVQWLPADVIDQAGSRREFWIPHFATSHSVLDAHETDWGPDGFPIRWVISEASAAGLAAFRIPGVGSTIVLRRDVFQRLPDDLIGIDAASARSV